MNIVVDPAVSGDSLWRQHCAGNLVILTRLRALNDFVGCTAPPVGVDCTSTAIRDFVNVADERRFDEETVVELSGAPPHDAMLVFGSPAARGPTYIVTGEGG